MINWLTRKILDWRVQRAARHAFHRHLGFARRPWPLTPPLTTGEQFQLAQDITHWLTQQLSETATPYGINQYGVLLRLAEVQSKRAILWTYQSPTFSRHQAAAVLDQVAQQILTLPLDTYPRSTHLEAHLVSLGDILLAGEDSGRGASTV